MGTILKNKAAKKTVGFNAKEVGLLLSMVQHNAEVYKTLAGYESPTLLRLRKKLEQLKSE